MLFLDLRWARGGVAAIALVTGGCSDDGVTGQDGGTGEAADSGRGSTSASVSTTMTASATSPTSGNSADGGDDTSNSTDPTAPGETDGLDGSGGDTTGLDTGPAGDSGTDTGAPPEPECMVDADCMLVEDCCTCDAIPLGDAPPACGNVACEQSTCAAEGIDPPQAQCTFGHCELVPMDCNPLFVACDTPPPPCPPGTLPSVAGDCWSGLCVPTEDCNVVPACADCAPDETCVLTGTQVGAYYSCFPTNDACAGGPDCGCMAEVCEAPYVCGEGVGEAPLECYCPVC
jgi:hypothetical protein